MIEGFLLGVIVTCSLVASGYFFRFWRRTRDHLFLAFSLAFFIEGINRAAFLALHDPEGGNGISYSIRLVSYLLILAGIAYKSRTPTR
jgi:hypothetical protein